jgi:hypothetical protein
VKKSERISDLMRRLMDEAAREPSITVGRVLNICGLRGFAFLLLILAILNVVIFMVPFLSFFLGLPMVLLATQMVLGLHAPLFPGIIRQRAVSRSTLMDGLARAIYWIEKIEHYIKPRFTFLSAAALLRVHALFALALAVLVMLPIPLVNVPPAIGICFLAIGLLQRDGLFIVLAYAVGVWCFLLFKSLGHIAYSLTAG